MPARLAALAGLLLAALAVPAGAERLVTALSSDTVAISSNFSGTEVVVFGIIERDAQTVARAEPYEVVVVLKGPLRSLVARRKERVAGLWVNADSQVMKWVPTFMAVMSTAELPAIASDVLRARLGLGADMLPISREPSPEPPLRSDFETAFLRLMHERGHYLEDPAGVGFLSEQLFQAKIAIPETVPVGPYTATIMLFRGGALLATNTEELTVGKVDFEQWISDIAHRHGLLYGLATVLIACLTGWLAGVIFRKD